MTVELLVATSNPAKADRLALLCGALATLRVPQEEPPVVDETAATHIGNAIAKAVGWARALRSVAIASDGGLVIPWLGAGWESTLTKRQTGEGVPDDERAKRLLSRMKGLEGLRREAYWAESVAIAADGDLLCAWEADGSTGRIGLAYMPDPLGAPGFWADGLWETLEGKKRWQLTEEERAGIRDPWSTLAGPVRDFLSRMS